VIAQASSLELAGLLSGTKAPERARNGTFRDVESGFQKLTVNPRSVAAFAPSLTRC